MSRGVVEHYTVGGMETIDFIYAKLGLEGGRAAVLANIIKYASRALHKGQFDSDVEKIRNYAVIAQEMEVKYAEKEGDEGGSELRDVTLNFSVGPSSDAFAAAMKSYSEVSSVIQQLAADEQAEPVREWQFLNEVPTDVWVLDRDGDVWRHQHGSWWYRYFGENVWWPDDPSGVDDDGPYVRIDPDPEPSPDSWETLEAVPHDVIVLDKDGDVWRHFDGEWQWMDPSADRLAWYADEGEGEYSGPYRLIA